MHEIGPDAQIGFEILSSCCLCLCLLCVSPVCQRSQDTGPGPGQGPPPGPALSLVPRPVHSPLSPVECATLPCTDHIQQVGQHVTPGSQEQENGYDCVKGNG